MGSLRAGAAQQAPAEAVDPVAAIRWSGFVVAAARLGSVHTVSMPLFTGSGAAVAVLNLYGRGTLALAPLAAGICTAP